jgi:putative transposase
MSRLPRLVLGNVPLHIVQRGNNRNPCFFSRSDFQVYLSILAESAEAHGCAVHAYALMTNHVHILASPVTASAPGRMMKGLGERYVLYVNRRYGRFGTLWQGRYRSCIVDSDRYFMVCQRYIELNPVRAGLVAHPEDYEWSSYRANAHGAVNAVITPHLLFSGLASDEAERRSSYRAMFHEAISESELAQVRDATNRDAAFGSRNFVDEMGAKFGRHIDRQRAGRRPT